MSYELLGIIINSFLSGIIISYLIWDHVHDDLRLKREVQDFFSSIEGLIYLFYTDILYKTFFNNNIINQEIFSAIDFRMIESTLYSRLIYFSQKILRKIEKYGLYLGLIVKFNSYEDLLNDTSKMYLPNKDLRYISDTDILLAYNGELRNLDDTPLFKDFINVQQDVEGYRIYGYMGSLRDYWKENHKRGFIRAELKISKDIKKHTQFRYDIKELTSTYETIIKPSLDNISNGIGVKAAKKKIEEYFKFLGELLKGTLRKSAHERRIP